MVNSEHLNICLTYLKKIFGDPVTAFEWLNFPHPSLNNARPWEVIMAGRGEEVILLLNRMQTSNWS